MSTPDNHRAQFRRIRQMHRQLQLPYREAPEDQDLNALERSLKYLLTIEEETTSTLSRQLISDGIELPPPDALDDDGIVRKLREVILGLARRHTILLNTNHLDNRALYDHLWTHTLNEPSHELDDSMGDCTEHIDLLGGGGEDSERLYLQYYADDFERDEWREDHRSETLPPKLSPPSHRDDHAPKRATHVRPEPDDSDFDEPWQAETCRRIMAATDYGALGSYKLAHAELDAVEKIDRNGMSELGATALRMELFCREQRWKDACTCGQRLCELAPDDHRFFVNHANALFEAMETEKSLRVLEAGPPSLRDVPLYHYHRARCEVDLGRIEDAITSLKTALAKDPSLRSVIEVDPDLCVIRNDVLDGA